MTVKQLERDIERFEGFPVRIYYARDGRDVRSDKGSLPSYSQRLERKAWGSHTIADWKRLRFAPRYPGFNVQAIRSNKKIAHGAMLLAKLRMEHEAA